MSVGIEREETVIEFTVRAVIAGIVFGVAFGAANAYLGLKVGLTVSTSIPIAVLTVALFKLGTILGIAIVLAVCVLLYRAGSDVAAEGSDGVEASTSAK